MSQAVVSSIYKKTCLKHVETIGFSFFRKNVILRKGFCQPLCLVYFSPAWLIKVLGHLSASRQVVSKITYISLTLVYVFHYRLIYELYIYMDPTKWAPTG